MSLTLVREKTLADDIIAQNVVIIDRPHIILHTHSETQYSF